MKLYEDLRENDLANLISSYISIDEYTSKIDEDNITVALFVNELDAAEELEDFIEIYYYIEIRDIEISDSLTDDNKYIIFVEVERNDNFPKMILDMIDTINFVADNKGWNFSTYQMNEPVELSEENIKKYVRLNKLRDTANIDTDETTVEENYKPFLINDNGWIRKYTPKRYISEDELNRIIESSKTFNDRDDGEIYLLENAFPGYEIITTDKNVFLIKNNKILMMV